MPNAQKRKDLFMTDQAPEEIFKIKEIQDAIDEFEQQIAGLPKLEKLEAPKYLYMSLEDLRKKTIEELSEAIFSIAQYAFYVQRLINKNNSWIRWGKSKLDELAVDYLDEVPKNVNSFERTMIAKNRPDICRKLNSFIRKINLENDRLTGTPEQLKILSDAIRDIKFSMIRNQKEQ